jgi:hypothetical protein
LLAGVLSTPERASAGVEADVLGLDIVVSVDGALLLAAFHGLLLAWTTALPALVASAVKLCSAGTEAHRLLDIALMAD